MKRDPCELKCKREAISHDLPCEQLIAVVAERDHLARRVKRLEGAVNWALGCGGGDWPVREAGQGSFYWRNSLAVRAGMVYLPKLGKYVSKAEAARIGARKGR